MKFFTSLLFLFINFILFSADYGSYNNLTEMAKKLMVAERHTEANLIFDIVDDNYKDFFKTSDLYYWAISLARVSKEKLAYKKLKIACKLQNDPMSVCGYLKYEEDDGAFDFLTQIQLEKLNTIQKKHEKYSPLYDAGLYREYKRLDSVDNHWGNFLADTVWSFEEGTLEYVNKAEIHRKNLIENNNKIVDLIIKKGYPSYEQIAFPITHLLYHMDSANWTRAKTALQMALKEGKIIPFDYAYIYYRATGEDKYNFREFIEISMRNIPKEKLLLQEKGKLGLGL